MPLRHNHKIATESEQGTVLIMPAWQEGRYLGIKTVNVFPGNASLGSAGPAFDLCALRRPNRRAARADGRQRDYVAPNRGSVCACGELSRAQERTRMTLLGAGRVGSLLPQAYRAVLPIQRSRRLGRVPASFGTAGRETRRTRLHARTVDNLPESVAAADIVTCATLATEPVVRGGWLAPGSHLDLIGSFTPAMREADDACFMNAQMFVDTSKRFRSPAICSVLCSAK